MNEKTKLDEIIQSEEFVFKMQRLVSQIALDDFGIILAPERLAIQDLAYDYMMQRAVRLILTLATQEETIAEVPIDWGQHLKQTMYLKWGRLIPKWLRRISPVKTRWIVAIHKFPELAVPESVLGREFVHLKYIDPDNLKEKLEKTST
jgi:hypothetical protein